LTPKIRVRRSKSSIFQRSDQMQGRSQTAWKQNATIPIVFHESIATGLKNAPFFEVPHSHPNRRRVADKLRLEAPV